MTTTAVTATSYYPCHDCGQTVEVIGGTKQPHDCSTFDTDTERLCASYWAGHDRGRAALAARVRAALEAGEHAVEVTATGYALQHAFTCRPNLLACPLDRALAALDGPPAAPGRYRVTLTPSGAVTIGEPVPADYDPLTAALTAALEGTDQ